MWFQLIWRAFSRWIGPVGAVAAGAVGERTHASIVHCGVAASPGTVAYWLVPLNASALPYRPCPVQVALPTIVPVLLFPESSATVFPDPALKLYAATSPGVTTPFPDPVDVGVDVGGDGCAVNAAVTLVAPDTVTVHVPVPPHPPPLHPVKVDPAAALADSVTTAPLE